MIIFFLISLLVALILLSGFLSSSETALFSLSSLQLKQFKQDKGSGKRGVAKLMERPREVLVTILMLNVVANILVQNTVSSLFEKSDDWSLKVGLPLFLTLVFGELLPKSIAMANNVAIAIHSAPWIDRVARWLGPIREKLTSVTSWLSRVFFLFMKDEEEISHDELRHILKTSEASGVLLPEESQWVGGALDLQQALVKERMRPRSEILYFDLQNPLAELIHLFTDQETTRVPICDGDLENLQGILSVRNFFLSAPSMQKGADVIPFLKKPIFVPETMRASMLLHTLRERGESLAMVVDEYGSISGLITQEDLIEGVIGEVTDRRDLKSRYTRSNEDVIIASGKLELTEFREIFGVALESEGNVVTLNGWLVERLGEIPSAGATYATDQFLFHVLAADPNRIRRVYVRRHRPLKKGNS